MCTVTVRCVLATSGLGLNTALCGRMTNLTLRRVATSVHLRKAALDRVAQVSSVNLSQNGYTHKRSKESLTLLIRYDSVGTP